MMVRLIKPVCIALMKSFFEMEKLGALGKNFYFLKGEYCFGKWYRKMV